MKKRNSAAPRPSITRSTRGPSGPTRWAVLLCPNFWETHRFVPLFSPSLSSLSPAASQNPHHNPSNPLSLRAGAGGVRAGDEANSRTRRRIQLQFVGARDGEGRSDGRIGRWSWWFSARRCGSLPKIPDPDAATGGVTIEEQKTVKSRRTHTPGTTVFKMEDVPNQHDGEGPVQTNVMDGINLGGLQIRRHPRKKQV
ncbi:uncharacterized protein LOC123396297 [Hordeum vulgare subsp. vulgare]|uniref:uncharacterized protein LOC123396297 n=1 Tax=Hordeum vulgare subsp. vulgare TaxID=112509 RepID=UPI001D1A3DA1|nr:uncharacterized protein LOC123396297 [Hordeum vulgare subsp. vulgare]